MPSREVKVAIIGDPSSLQRALRTSEQGVSSFTSKMQSAAQRMRSVGRSMTVGLTLPLVGFGVLAARELQAAQQAMGQTRAVIESMGLAGQVTADQVADLASEMHEISGMDDEALQEMLNTLLTFRNVVPIFEEAGEATQNLAAFFGDDLQTAATKVGRALNNPLRGMTALSRSGVEFTEQQRQSIEAMMAFGDVAGAQQIILQELGDEFGGQAAALGETVGGRFNKLKNDLEEVGASILESLIPAFEDLAGALEGLMGWYQDLTPEQQKWVSWAVLATAVAGPLISAIGGIASALLLITAHPIVLVAAAVVALIAAIVILIMHWGQVSAAMSSFVRLAVGSIPGVRTAVMLVGEAIHIVRSAVGHLIDGIARLGGMTLAALQAAIGVLTGNLQAAVNAASTLLSILGSINNQQLAKGPIAVASNAGSSMANTDRMSTSKLVPRRSPGAVVANRANSFDGMKQAFKEALREEVQMVHVTNDRMAEVY